VPVWVDAAEKQKGGNEAIAAACPGLKVDRGASWIGWDSLDPPRQGGQTPPSRNGPVRIRTARRLVGASRRVAARTLVLRHRRGHPRSQMVGDRGSSRASPAGGQRRRPAPVRSPSTAARACRRARARRSSDQHIQRQLGHTDLGTTSTYLQGIDPSEIIVCRPLTPPADHLRHRRTDPLTTKVDNRRPSSRRAAPPSNPPRLPLPATRDWSAPANWPSSSLNRPEGRLQHRQTGRPVLLRVSGMKSRSRNLLAA
jgi:hypothetical protein